MSDGAPDWAQWSADGRHEDLTVGVEEEVMLLDPEDWALANRVEEVLPSLPEEIREHVTLETHTSALELATGVHARVSAAIEELRHLRVGLEYAARLVGLRLAVAATHPTAVWHSTEVSTRRRYRALHDTMRELARREPTFALHVHLGVHDPDEAIGLANRLRVHAPLLLALSANSPFWQGRATGILSTRTPLFQAFPRVGLPRPFRDYAEYVEAVDCLVRTGAIPDPTFLWWDVRPQPRLGTVELRIMDAQTRLADAAGLVALVQSLALLELNEGYASERAIHALEALEENRFLAARDGAHGCLIDVDADALVPVSELTAALVERCRPHADALGCGAELESVMGMLETQGADRQLDLAEGLELPDVVETLARSFAEEVRRVPAPSPG
ncbi:MAG: YbdK family carboxylate-amine ligase [Actinomycetota bacterium]|nr:YbdK family carboxylate-amine ligase [Actinomycetota bacterium]